MRRPPPFPQLHRRLNTKPRLLPPLLLALSIPFIFWTYINLLPTSPNHHHRSFQHHHYHHRHPKSSSPRLPIISPQITNTTIDPDPYHNWSLFQHDFNQMLQHFKIFVYPHAFINHSSKSNTNHDYNPNSPIFSPHPYPNNPKLGNFYSEHMSKLGNFYSELLRSEILNMCMFKISLLKSSLITHDPEKAHFFFLPFSINALRNDPRVRSEAAIAEFVSGYVVNVSKEFGYWNASRGSDHFFVCCHSIGRDAVSRHFELHNNAVQVTCSSSYFQRLFVAHKDVGLPQVWPRPNVPEVNLTPPDARHNLIFFAGRVQNSNIRRQLIDLWGNDTDVDVFETPPYSYEEGFKRSKYCLHVKGYEVNTARVSDAIHFGCIPVIVSNYYDLPFANILEWSKFSVIINQWDIAFLKEMLLSISGELYLTMFRNLCSVRKHFEWHVTPRGYDSFHMTAYQLWLKRSVHRLPITTSKN